MKILITGGAGFIGSFIAKNLVEQGDEVAVFDNFLNFINPVKSHYPVYLQYRLKHILNGIEIIRGDVRNKALVLSALKRFKPQRVIHLAAVPLANISNKFSEEIFDINMNGTMSVLEAIRECGFVDRFLFTSSSTVYGDFEYIPADEKHPTNPINLYGGTKLSGEILTKVFCRMLKIDYTIIRPSTVYGPTDANRRVSQILVENALMGKPLTLHGGGLSKLDFSFIEDTAQGFCLAIKSDKAANQTFNITCGNARSLKELTEILENIIPGLKVTTEELPEGEKRPERGTLDISKAKKLLGYKPKYQLEDGLKIYIDFIKKEGVLNDTNKS